MNRKTQRLFATVLVSAGIVTATQSSLGQTVVANELYLGFQNQAGGGTADYIIDLGQASTLIGGSSVIDLSSYFNLTNFKSVLRTSTSLFGGVVGGSNAGNPSSLYFTQARSGGAGMASVAGSSVSSTFSIFGDNQAYAPLTALNAPASAGLGILDSTKTWESQVEPTFSPSSFYGNLGSNPDSAVGTTTVYYADLWSTSSSLKAQPCVYQGYFTLDLTGGNSKLTFTPKNTPSQLGRPVSVAISTVAGVVTVVSSNAVASHSYQLQYTVSLTPTTWINTGSAVVATATLVTNTDASATSAQRFYRVQAQ